MLLLIVEKMNDEERRNVSIPESVTINGITYVVRDTPELQKFMQAVSKVEKNKLYSQFESLKIYVRYKWFRIHKVVVLESMSRKS